MAAAAGYIFFHSWFALPALLSVLAPPPPSGNEPVERRLSLWMGISDCTPFGYAYIAIIWSRRGHWALVPQDGLFLHGMHNALGVLRAHASKLLPERLD